MLSHWKKCTKQKYVRPDAFRNNEPFGGKEIKPDVTKKPETRIDVCFDRGMEGLCDDLISARRATSDTINLVKVLRLLEDRMCSVKEIARLSTYTPPPEHMHHLHVLGKMCNHDDERIRELALRVIQKLASTRVGRVSMKNHGTLKETEHVITGRRHPAPIKLEACSALRIYASTREGARALIESKEQSAKALLTLASSENTPPKLRESCLYVLAQYLEGGPADMILAYTPKLMSGLIGCLNVEELEFDEEFQTEPDEEDLIHHEGLVRVAHASLSVLKRACLSEMARQSALQTKRATSLLVPYLQSESVDVRRDVSSVLMSLSGESAAKLEWTFTANLIRVFSDEKDRIVLENLARLVSNICVVERIRVKLREVKFSEVLSDVVKVFHDDRECGDGLIGEVCEDAIRALAWDP